MGGYVWPGPSPALTPSRFFFCERLGLISPCLGARKPSPPPCGTPGAHGAAMEGLGLKRARVQIFREKVSQ